jgi:hypothetical protein
MGFIDSKQVTHDFRRSAVAKLRRFELMFLVRNTNPSGLYYILVRMSVPDRKGVVFQATAVDTNKHHYAIQTAPDGLFYAWKDNYPSAGPKHGPGLEKFTLTADELRTKFASGEWRLLEGSIP